MQDLILFGVAILIMSVVVHEVSHGYVANILGDPTARLSGRLTLNPIKHLDPMGSVLVPALLILVNSGFIFGWARPVPYNPYNLKNGKWGPGLVAFAGPASNIVIALVFAMIIRFVSISGAMLEIFALTVLINLVLAMFNLIPIPPLDGSKILASLLPARQYIKWSQFETRIAQYGLISVFLFVLVFVYILADIFYLILEIIFRVLTGVPIGYILGF